MPNNNNLKLWCSLKLWKSTTQLLIVGYAIGMSSISHAAATLSAVVIPNTGGYVGNTAVVPTSTLTGALKSSSYGTGYGMAIISISPVGCTSKNSLTLGKSGVYGIALKNSSGVNSGAVMVPDGTARWERKLSTGQVVTGNVVYDKGRWTNSWSTNIGGVRTSQSNADGGSPYSPSSIFCPNVPNVAWDANYVRNSSVDVRFFIDAPDGGLPAGKYTLANAAYHGDYSYSSSGDKVAALVTGINIIVAKYSCSLSTDKNSVSLNNLFPEATINLRVQCQDDGPSSEPVATWLSAASAGVSASITTGNPQMLGVQNSAGLMTIRGSWSGTAPVNCNDTSLATTLYFDSRDGIKAGDVAVNGSLTKDQPVSFRLCTTGSPATGTSYRAQATFSVVQR